MTSNDIRGSQSGENISAARSTLKITNRKNSTMPRDGDHHFSEIEFIKRDIADKNQQIAHLNQRVEQFQQLAESLYKLIQDLETATSLSFINHDLPNPFSSTHELVFVTRRALDQLLKIHKELPDRFEADFSKKATEIVGLINEKSNEIDKINEKRKLVENDIKDLERLAHIQETETNSLKQISETLEQQRVEIDETHKAEASVLQDQISSIRSSVKGLKQISKGKAEKNRKIERAAYQPLNKRTLDSIKEDIEIQEEIESLQKRINRELVEHEMTNAELELTRVDIERAKAVIEKFKKNLTKEQKDKSDRVNSHLKMVIEQQREDYKRAMKNQKKANVELDKQRTDLIEEERMLRNYLISLEKQLQAQMQKLPSLSVLQHRFEPISPQKRGSLSKSKQRAPDDAEMRTIKKAILRMQNRKGLGSRSSLMVGKNLR
ncbi:hypothetical protein TRFO_19892 [Tritrichomonas foetus]|uniref:Uncharacterized protein n=1 Tax=Tritrichomonas foetus TaxID=1144522 RepID=A0A1J4KMZ6_9EUKA|nr:hypothetical protein TRFO_19892 [Tritrichomonas foetus]|eukprot:OHT10757.1 hypothetical protein TRFO_19892 [Tritrichomonas foetus]